MPEKTFSCGSHQHFIEKDYGKSFQCKRCNKIHSFPPNPNKPKKESPPPFQPKSILIKPNLLSKLAFYLIFIKEYLLAFFSKTTTTPSPKVNYTFKSSTPYYFSNNSTSTSLLPTHLQKMQEELIQKAWRKDEGPSSLYLSPHHLSPPNWDFCIRQMLKHAEKVAPQIPIPYKTPRLVFKLQSKDSGGTFEVDEEGYVTITIDSALQNNHRAALAVLSHELCHYILGSNGIKRSARLANEQLTDVCMFVLGFGDIFLNGYQTAPNRIYGYLKSEQYNTLKKNLTTAWANRNSATLLNSKEEELEKWVIGVVYRGDKGRYHYNYNFMRKKHPNFSKMDILVVQKQNS